MDPLLASIIIFAGNFAPRGFLLCQGQILSISQNTALFSLLGTTYGGNGTTTFALPDLRGRVPIQQGQGPGLSNYVLGEASGSENTTLLITNLPQHNHPLIGTSEAGSTSDPTGAFLGNTGALDPEYNTSGTHVQMNAAAIGLTGGSQPINNIQPYLAINYIIATSGVFPSRN
ncbi:MAG TPA: tail fiber protein [Ginsengibacter sp.]